VIFTGSKLKMIGDFKRIMMKEFEMTGLDLISYFLGIEVIQAAENFTSPNKNPNERWKTRNHRTKLR